MVAEDMGSPNVRRGIATLVVQVTDSNDNSPVFVEVSIYNSLSL